LQRGCKRTRGSQGRGAAVLGLALALAAGGARGEPPTPEGDAPPPIALDRLLKLPPPSGESAAGGRIGNATKGEWRARFASARAERDAARDALGKAQKELEEVAGETEAWQIAPPGAGASNASDAPVSYSLRQEVRRQREEVARSERRLQELTVEADLAGVPADWRD
jgi:hypothetical protein